MFARESFPSPGFLQIATLQKDKYKYMLLHVPSSGFQEEKLCLLCTNTPEETQTKGAEDSGDSPGQDRAMGCHHTLVCTPALWSSRWPR